MNPLSRFLSQRDAAFVRDLTYLKLERERNSSSSSSKRSSSPTKRKKGGDKGDSKYAHLAVHISPPPTPFDCFAARHCIYCSQTEVLFFCLQCYVVCCDGKKHAYTHFNKTGHGLFLYRIVGFEEDPPVVILFIKSKNCAPEEMDYTNSMFSSVLEIFQVIQ